MLAKYKNIIIIGVIAAVGLIAYSILRPDPTVKNLLETTQRQNSTQVLGNEITGAINQINTLRLDRSVLDDSILINLIDHSKPILPEPIGRINPFAPIGSGDMDLSRQASLEDDSVDQSATTTAPSNSTNNNSQTSEENN